MSVLAIMLMIAFLLALSMAHLTISLVMIKHTICIFGGVVFGFRAWYPR